MTQDDIVDTLNELIETSKDGEYGFRTSAEHLTSVDVRALFLRRADECRDAAVELQALVQQAGGKAEDSGSTLGAMHRGWVAVKGTLAGYSEATILEETERGEDSALATYRKALKQDLPANIRTVIERQYDGVQRNHDQVRRLRDGARAAEN